jgi:hypothetical protein
VEPKRNTMVGQDVPDGDAEGGPRKLDQGQHGAYMTDAKRNRKRRGGVSICGCLWRTISVRGVESIRIRQRSDSAIAWLEIFCLINRRGR